MTQNQIRLGELKEAIRHNQAMENVQKDTNRINEEHFVRADAETGRHNLITEGQTDQQLVINRNTLSETIRHNKQSEAAAFMQASAAQTSAGAALLNAQASQRQAALAEQMQPYAIRAKQSEQYLNNARAASSYADYAYTNENTKRVMNDSALIAAKTQSTQAQTEGQLYTNEYILPSQKGEIDSRTFNNTTGGVRNITGVIKDLSDVTGSWVDRANGSKKRKSK